MDPRTINGSGVSLTMDSLTHQSNLAAHLESLPVPAQTLSENGDMKASSSQETDDSAGNDHSWNEDYDSDDSAVSSTASVDHSVLDHFYENGRRYHRFREGLYPFPNDAMEQERERMLHALTLSLCGGMLHTAPIGNNPQRVMDLGTGTGAWAIDMADKFPSADVVGVDLSPIQPRWVPPNVSFMVDDIEAKWPFPYEHFDYVHCRHNALSIRDWPKTCRTSFNHLKPGGWFELQDIQYDPRSIRTGASLGSGNAVSEYWQVIKFGLGIIGVDLSTTTSDQMVHAMHQACFVNVTVRTTKVPIGGWPDDEAWSAIGRQCRDVFLHGLQSLALGPMMRCLEWDRSRVELLLMDARRAYQDDSTLMYMPFYTVYGQKPFEEA